MRSRVISTVVCAVVLVLLGSAARAVEAGSTTEAGERWQPRGGVKMIVPFAPGGGSDRSARVTADAIEAVTDINVNVENRDGGNGAVGYSYFLGEQGNANTLLATESALLALPIGLEVPFSYQDFTPIMQIAEDFSLLVTAADSPFQDCAAAIEAARGERVIAGISGRYGVDNANLTMTEQVTGVSVDRVTYESGGEMVAGLLGGQVDIGLLNPGEVAGQLQSGDLKPLCVFADERYAYDALADVPTAKEQGIDVAIGQFRGIIAPGGITEAQRQYWIDVLTRALDTEELRGYVEQDLLQPVTAPGDDFATHLADEADLYRRVFS